MSCWFFVSDLHGSIGRYEALFRLMERERPRAVLLGGDLLPGGPAGDFVGGWLAPRFARFSRTRVLLILGNDDPRTFEAAVTEAASRGIWEYVHDRRVQVDGVWVYGLAFVPPTPFPLKDWERYDVSRFVDPGAISPEHGRRTLPVPPHRIRFETIQRRLDALTEDRDLSEAVMLFHAPPYDTPLDRADLDGQAVDHVPLDVHVGSIAIQRFIRARTPRITLHGHVHEAARITGSWRTRIGATFCLGAAHDGPELALVRFDPRNPEGATRELIAPDPAGAAGRRR